MPTDNRRLLQMLFDPRALLRLVREYVGAGRKRDQPIYTYEDLGRFLDTRASFVAQTSLYGYLRTRAGARYPELFDDDAFVESINIAKWQMWLACLSDLSIYAGGLLAQRTPGTTSGIGEAILATVSGILAATGIPPDAGPAFEEHARRLRARVAGCEWATITDDETPFGESPAALVTWAPIIDELKQLDEDIVRNSVRFRWQEVRRDLRRLLDAGTLCGTGAPATAQR
ncbi:MAG: esterase [Rhodocyclales bacterium]|nr:esterase [Rhodocyclales bacterium]